ncbi:hypothetical protein [Azotosporobacter soli]|uniref:hypothetical protein n=1 Tax=Azotosporobacter soli TaxID=3055040 RepID=UPI0031FEC84A
MQSNKVEKDMAVQLRWLREEVQKLNKEEKEAVRKEICHLFNIEETTISKP